MDYWKLFRTQEYLKPKILTKVSQSIWCDRLFPIAPNEFFLLKVLVVKLHSGFNLALSQEGGEAVQTDPQKAVFWEEEGTNIFKT